MCIQMKILLPASGVNEQGLGWRGGAHTLTVLQAVTVAAWHDLAVGTKVEPGGPGSVGFAPVPRPSVRACETGRELIDQ